MMLSAALALSTPTDDLTGYAGAMLQDSGVEIVTTESLPAVGALSNEMSWTTKNAKGATKNAKGAKVHETRESLSRVSWFSCHSRP